MSDTEVAEILKLPAEERLRLVELIWESLSAAPSGVPLPDGHRAAVDDELANHRRDPNDVHLCTLTYAGPWCPISFRGVLSGRSFVQNHQVEAGYQVLEPGPSELALRMARATLAAAEVFGDIDAGRAYLRTKNFALGGAAPIDLLQTAEGERIVSQRVPDAGRRRTGLTVPGFTPAARRVRSA